MKAPFKFLLLFILFPAPSLLWAQVCALNVVAGSPVTLSNTYVTYCSASIAAGATLVIGGAVTMNVTGNVDIEGTVEGTGLGYGSVYAPTAGPGAGTSGGGGGHGGMGGNDAFTTGFPTGGGPINDSPANPVLMGSAGSGVVLPPISGGFFGPPSTGGAAFLLNATGTVTINGLVDMSGDGGFGTYGYYYGGGAGGTISISAQTILFNGTLNAIGGAGTNGTYTDAAGGGGGLILLCPSVNFLSGSGTYSVAGGAAGSVAASNGIGGPATNGGPGVYTACTPLTPTPTPPATNTPIPTPILTLTPTPVVPAEVFQICKNVFNVTADGTVCITIGTMASSGEVALRIYNSVGEHIKTLFDQNITQPLAPTVITWDGTNKYEQKVASGVYVIYLQKPLGRSLGRLVVIH